jgi:hypothetical protein
VNSQFLRTLAIAMLLATPAAAKCHIFSIWHYPRPQRCFVAPARPVPRPTERIEIPVPAIEFEICPEGGERMLGIAKLRAMSDGP